ncbi:hypothetical protein [Catenulispora pinisilvae]|uniref:hypothetical protein n=1 Tax=Catenulispora pinisilvae TaxID=2705253 RepID=UPI001891A35D|nr:hypothetical protein [Catenulispora pinisilvae]
MSIAVNLGRVVIMRQVADWLSKHATLPIDHVVVRESGSVTISPSSYDIKGSYDYGRAEIHNLYAIAEAAGVEVSVTSREYALGWQLTAIWQIGQIPVESEVTLSRMAAAVRQPEQVETGDSQEPAADQTPELIAAHS